LLAGKKEKIQNAEIIVSSINVGKKLNGKE
jgi:hypothetical protein